MEAKKDFENISTNKKELSNIDISNMKPVSEYMKGVEEIVDLDELDNTMDNILNEAMDTGTETEPGYITEFDTGSEGEGTGSETIPGDSGFETGEEGTGTENEGTGEEGTGTETIPGDTGPEGTGTENEGTGSENEGTGSESAGER